MKIKNKLSHRMDALQPSQQFFTRFGTYSRVEPALEAMKINCLAQRHNTKLMMWFLENKS